MFLFTHFTCSIHSENYSTHLALEPFGAFLLQWAFPLYILLLNMNEKPIFRGRNKDMKLAYEDEREVYLYDHRDGLGDILAGILILSFGVGVLTEMFWFSAIWVPLLIPVWRKTKKRVNAGRLSPDELSPSQMKGANTRLLMMVALGSVTLLVGLVFFTLMLGASDLFWLKSWLSTYFELVFGVIMALLLSAVGAINRAGRFYVYAILALIILTSGYLFELHFGISLTLLGGLILVSGLVVLFRFLSEYPEKNG